MDSRVLYVVLSDIFCRASVSYVDGSHCRSTRINHPIRGVVERIAALLATATDPVTKDGLKEDVSERRMTSSRCSRLRGSQLK